MYRRTVAGTPFSCTAAEYCDSSSWRLWRCCCCASKFPYMGVLVALRTLSQKPSGQRKAPTEVGAFQEIPAATYSPRGGPPSTIGAGGLDCCVRNGNRYISTAITTGNHWRSATFAARTGVAGSLSVLERARTSNSKPSAD